MARTHELLLLETVDNLGIVGDVVKVKTGFARNFLLPRGLATTPTDEKIAELSERRAAAEAELKARITAQSSMIEKLTDHEITLERSANDQGVLFGGVSPHEVAEHLRDEGFEIEDRHVRLGETIKRLDSYHIPIVINKDLKTEIKLWVVSDRPMEAEEEENDEEQGEQGDNAEQGQAVEAAPVGEAADA